MLDLNNDEKCQYIHQLLSDYVNKCNEAKKAKRRYFAAGESKFDVDNYMFFYDKNLRRSKNEFFSNLKEYISSQNNKEDKSQIAGHFLWTLRNKYHLNKNSFFVKEAVSVCSYLLPYLNDKDKIQFMEYLFTIPKANTYNKKQGKDLWQFFPDNILPQFIDINPNKNIPAINRLYNKALNHIDKMPRKCKALDEKIAIFGKMFDKFAENVELLTENAVINFSEIYIKLCQKSSKPISSNILLKLAQKTKNAKEVGDICSCKQNADKRVVKQIFAKYLDIVNASQTSDINDALTLEMIDFVTSSNLSVKDLSGIINLLESSKNKKSSKKIEKINNMIDVLGNHLDEKLLERHQRTLMAINKTDNEEYYNGAVLRYAKDLFEYSEFRKNKEIDILPLYELLTIKGSTNKELLKDVVSIYGTTLKPNDLTNYEYNYDFFAKMTKMMQNIVVNENYSDKDLFELRVNIAKGGDYHEEFSYMASLVERATNMKQDWRTPPPMPITPIDVKKEIER